MKKMKSIKTRISIYVLIVSIACSLIIGCFSLVNYKHNLEEYMGQKALDISKAVSVHIDGDKIAEYDKTGVKDEYYQEIADYLGRVKSDVDLKYLYIMVDAGSDYKYIVEGVGKNDTEEPSLLGDTQTKDEYGPETAEALSTGEGAYSDIYDNGEYGDLLSGFAPVFDSKGKVTGVVGLDIGVDMLEKSIAAYLPILLLIMVLTCGVSYLLISIVVRKTVVEPLTVLEDVSSRLSGGHFDIQIPQTYLDQPDEIGNLSRAFVKVAKYLKSITQEIAHVLIESANKNSGIAQALAEGSNEQASAIEELFASIHMVSADVAQNVEDVHLANNFVAEVGESVVISNDDMQRLLAAMNEIDESSRQIADIIKIIDNITFQTKILSLNASVEAALAGKSGKGFAVVAEEVRNLALRSADAAKKTAALIENTLGSVRKGTEIAEVTAQALANVSDKTHLVNDIIYKITEASKGQAVSISKIQQSIDQISVIVQRNSSAAEDSALASEELCKQAAQLRREISEIAHT